MNRAEPRDKKGYRWIWLAIPIAACLSLALQWHTESKTPESSDWEPVLAHLDANINLHDGVLVSPDWHTSPWATLEKSMRNAGHPGTFIHAHPLTTMDTLRYPRIWVILPRGGEVPTTLESCENIALESPVRLFLCNRIGSEPLFDFREKLSDAKVFRTRKKGHKISCSWKKDRQKCKTSKRMYDVRSQVGEVGDTRREALFAHPYPSHGTLNLVYDSVKGGETLSVGYGLALRGVRMEKGGDILLRILVDDVPLWETIIPRDDFSWNGVNLPLEGKDRKRNFTFQISSEDVEWRHFFVDALLL